MGNTTFWNAEKRQRSAAMRAYRELWRGLPLDVQWKMECFVYAQRGAGRLDSTIRRELCDWLDAMRPWQATDAKLLRMWRTRQRDVELLRSSFHSRSV